MSENLLTERQQKFCDEYIKTLNATQSALKAGYSEATSKRAPDWINKDGQNRPSSRYKPHLTAYIDARMEEHKKKDIADQEEILRVLTDVIRGKSKSATLMGVGGGAEVIEEAMPPTTAERIKAAELLGKRYAMWTDKQEVNAVITPVFIDDIGDDDE